MHSMLFSRGIGTLGALAWTGDPTNTIISNAIEGAATNSTLPRSLGIITPRMNLSVWLQASRRGDGFFTVRSSFACQQSGERANVTFRDSGLSTSSDGSWPKALHP